MLADTGDLILRKANLPLGSNQPSREGQSVDFIRLLFIDPVEERIAHRWASRLAGVIGTQALRLRPETTLAQMLDWAAAAKADSMDFVVVFEPELRMEFANFLDCADHVTFREMVQHHAGQFGRDCALEGDSIQRA